MFFSELFWILHAIVFIRNFLWGQWRYLGFGLWLIGVILKLHLYLGFKEGVRGWQFSSKVQYHLLSNFNCSDLGCPIQDSTKNLFIIQFWLKVSTVKSNPQSQLERNPAGLEIFYNWTCINFNLSCVDYGGLICVKHKIKSPNYL